MTGGEIPALSQSVTRAASCDARSGSDSKSACGTSPSSSNAVSTSTETSRSPANAIFSLLSAMTGGSLKIIDGGTTRLRNAAPGKHFDCRPGKNSEVELEREMLHVIEVQFETFLPAQSITAVHLRQSGDPRPDVMPASLLWGVERQILHEQRPRANQAHLAREHVPQLWNLVQTRGAEPAPERRETFGVRQESAGGVVPVCHGPEFDQRERHAVKSRATLTE